MNLNRLVASNALNANHNIMRQLEEKGEKFSVQWFCLKNECDRITKRYPSLAWIISRYVKNIGEYTNP